MQKTAGRARPRALARWPPMHGAHCRQCERAGTQQPGSQINIFRTQVDVQVALAATKPVQGRYRCRLWCAIAGPAAVKQLQHEYQAAGEAVESPLATSNLR